MNVSDTTRLAFQSAIAVMIATGLGEFLPVDKGYWVTLTAMALSVQTWGESLKKAVERVLMTILGGTIGTFLYVFLPSDTYVLFGMSMVFIFFAVYMNQINHQLNVLFITAFVVFLFALVADWNIALLGYRIIDTLIGAAIALSVSYFFAGESVSPYELLVGHLTKLLNKLQKMADNLNDQSTSFTDSSLDTDFIALRNQALAARYEMMFHRYNRRQFLDILKSIGLITQNISLLASTQSWFGHKLDDKERESLKASLLLTIEQIKKLIVHMQTKQQVDFYSTRPFLNQVLGTIRDEPKRFLVNGEEGFTFYRMMYYLYRINVRIVETGEISASKGKSMAS
ncbi:FUSC family protein [Legionella sp. W05-934-2]|jgi:uncharacterized membrane protein YccC|uniref:FUSC family protein n=1 Tax=Legionella sp. W05-934-2 TaxID=1198649 RepID=UPI0034623FCA